MLNNTGKVQDSIVTGSQVDQIKALLSSLDPDLLQKLLIEILKE
jgi:hypothetical protein